MKNFDHYNSNFATNRFTPRAGDRAGSALLVAILVMGILMTLTLGLSSLVIREIRQTADVVSSGRAYFAAEAGMEQALYDLSQNLPGYETLDLANAVDGWVVYPDGGQDDNLSYRYRIRNKGDAIPYFPEDEPIFLSPDIAPQGAVTKDFLYSSLPDETYNVLPLNQTVTIPLFSDNGDGTFTDVRDFLVEYYVDFELDEDVKRVQTPSGPVQLKNFDVLRWKVFGNPDPAQGGDLSKTDAISDFYPALDGDGPTSPVCIGSDSSQDIFAADGCNIPVAQELVGGSLDPIQAAWSIARECYITEVSFGSVGNMEDNVLKRCSIKNFMDTHTRNYITLSNIVNPDIIGVDPIIKPQAANIYYRVVARSSGAKLVREAAEINSDGYANNGRIQQSLNAKIKLSSFLPVFNFSLYRTDTQSEIDTPEGDAASKQNIFSIPNIPLLSPSI